MTSSAIPTKPSGQELQQYSESIGFLRTITIHRQILYSVLAGWNTAKGIQESVFGFTPHEIRVARDELVQSGVLDVYAFINDNGNAQKAYSVIGRTE